MKEKLSKKLLTVNQAAERLAVKPSTIRSWILKRQHLDAVKVGRCVRITEESVERLIDENTTQGREEK